MRGRGRGRTARRVLFEHIVPGQTLLASLADGATLSASLTVVHPSPLDLVAALADLNGISKADLTHTNPSPVGLASSLTDENGISAASLTHANPSPVNLAASLSDLNGISTATITLTAPAGGIDANATLVLHGNGTNASTTFVNSASTTHTVTPAGNAQLDTSVKKFGTASMKFDGSGDHLSVTQNLSDFAYGTGDFAIDGQVRWNSTAGTQVLYDGRPAASAGKYPLLFLTGGTLNLFVDGSTVISGGSFVTGQFYHVAITRNGTSTRLTVDGVQVGSTYTDTNNYLAPPSELRIAESIDNGSAFNGWLDEFRTSKGVSRWSTFPFTPPSVEYF